jgi:hypothetical protein
LAPSKNHRFSEDVLAHWQRLYFPFRMRINSSTYQFQIKGISSQIRLASTVRMETLRSGVHYPRSWEEFIAWFDNEDDCRDYLDWLRWRDGFQCPHCPSTSGWCRANGKWDCAGCGRIVTQTAGTIFDKTRTPLTYKELAKLHRPKRRGRSPTRPTNPQLVRQPLGRPPRPWRNAP